VVGARLLSGSVNFLLNRRVFVADGSGGRAQHAMRYAALALLLLSASYGSLHAFTTAGVPLLPAKIATDVVLYLASFTLQKHVVFAPAPGTAATSVAGARDAETRACSTEAVIGASTTRPTVGAAAVVVGRR
jgi:hypothetical protein